MTIAKRYILPTQKQNPSATHTQVFLETEACTHAMSNKEYCRQYIYPQNSLLTENKPECNGMQTVSQLTITL